MMVRSSAKKSNTEPWTDVFSAPPLPLQGLYVFAVYFVMHNQLCWPTKASYTVEMSGHDGPDSTYQGGGPTTVGADISKSTQNLISAMEEVNTQRKCSETV